MILENGTLTFAGNPHEVSSRRYEAYISLLASYSTSYSLSTSLPCPPPPYPCPPPPYPALLLLTLPSSSLPCPPPPYPALLLLTLPSSSLSCPPPPYPALLLLTLPSSSLPCPPPPYPALLLLTLPSSLLTLPSTSLPCPPPPYPALHLLTLPSSSLPCPPPPYPALLLLTLPSTSLPCPPPPYPALLLLIHTLFALSLWQGINYLISMGVLDDCSLSIAEFIHHTQSLNWQSLDKYLQSRPSVLDCLIELQGYADMFLPDALRAFFSNIPAPNERGQFLESLLNKFSTRYVQCNHKTTTMSKGENCL